MSSEFFRMSREFSRTASSRIEMRSDRRLSRACRSAFSSVRVTVTASTTISILERMSSSTTPWARRTSSMGVGVSGPRGGVRRGMAGVDPPIKHDSPTRWSAAARRRSKTVAREPGQCCRALPRLGRVSRTDCGVARDRERQRQGQGRRQWQRQRQGQGQRQRQRQGQREGQEHGRRAPTTTSTPDRRLRRRPGDWRLRR